jgi:predicted Zn-dependent protease
MSRVDAIRRILDKSPNDPFPRYGLAMELKNAGRFDEARSEFEELERRHPDYVAQYLMHLNVLVALQRRDDAKAVGARGLEASRRKGDMHALNELQAAIDAIDQVD